MDVVCRHNGCTYHRTADSLEHAAQKLLRHVRRAHPDAYKEGKTIVMMS